MAEKIALTSKGTKTGLLFTIRSTRKERKSLLTNYELFPEYTADIPQPNPEIEKRTADRKWMAGNAGPVKKALVSKCKREQHQAQSEVRVN